MSVSLKEFLADIDVSLGGRVAEELSMSPCNIELGLNTDQAQVFGSENVTSGASSDLKHATGLATRMVKVWGLLSNHPT